jgi:hypothetical protein
MHLNRVEAFARHLRLGRLKKHLRRTQAKPLLQRIIRTTGKHARLGPQGLALTRGHGHAGGVNLNVRDSTA